MRGLKDRSVIVTGGANGIGAAIARRLAEEGCTVGVFDLDAATARDGRGRDQGEPAAREPACASTSPTTRRSTRAVADVRGGDAGRSTFLVNNAGWDRAANFLDTTPEFWRQDHRHQSVRPAQHEPRRAEGHGGARLRPRRQHRLRRRPRRLVGRGGLFGLQGRHDRLHQDDGARAGRQGHHRQHRLPGPDRHRDPAELPAKAPTATSIARGPEARHPDAAARRSPRTIPGSSPSCSRDDAAYITGQTISVSGGLTMHG